MLTSSVNWQMMESFFLSLEDVWVKRILFAQRKITSSIVGNKMSDGKGKKEGINEGDKVINKESNKKHNMKCLI